MSGVPSPHYPASHPVRLAASNTLTLPRWGLCLLCLLYILPGLLGRDPWKGSDASDFGVMWTMAHGTLADWLWPNIAGTPVPDPSLLTCWVGALCIKLFGWALGDIMAARVSTLLFFALSAWAIWQTAFLLGKREESQPMRLAFGGQPDPISYGRVMADGALLIYLGFLGLLKHSHETSVESSVVSLAACIFWLFIRYSEAPGWKRSLPVGFALACLLLVYGWVLPFSFLVGFLLAAFLAKRLHKVFFINFLIMTVTAVLCSAVVLGFIQLEQPYGSSPLQAWMSWSDEMIGWPSFASISYYFRYSIWFFWPAWPFAIWAVYAWRHKWHSPHIAIPLALVIVFSLFVFCNPRADDNTLLVILPPLAILAIFGLPTMRRGAINAIDWFSVMTLTTCAIMIWTGWISIHNGWPAKIAKNIARQTPGFLPDINLFATAVALCATLGWIALVYWRVSRRPSVLWRAVVLSSGGVILCWLLLGTLWLPSINYTKSYARVSQELGEQMAQDPLACVNGQVDLAQLASFAYYGHIRFAGFNHSACTYLLKQIRVPKGTQPRPPEIKNMRLIWEGRRASDRQERYLLYKRLTPPDETTPAN